MLLVSPLPWRKAEENAPPGQLLGGRVTQGCRLGRAFVFIVHTYTPVRLCSEHLQYKMIVKYLVRYKSTSDIAPSLPNSSTWHPHSTTPLILIYFARDTAVTCRRDRRASALDPVFCQPAALRKRIRQIGPPGLLNLDLLVFENTESSL